MKPQLKNKKFRAVLVNLEPEVCEKFHKLAKVQGMNATKLARKLILNTVNDDKNHNE